MRFLIRCWRRQSRLGKNCITNQNRRKGKGHGGFGGERFAPPKLAYPERTPDYGTTEFMPENLAAIYRLAGDTYGSWRAMEKLYKDGYIRAIGVSNFEPYRLEDLTINNEVVPAVNQAETHPFCQQTKLKETMAEWNIKLTASEGLAQGQRGLFTDPVFTKIGKKYGKIAAQVVLRWHVQREDIVIPKSVHKERMRQNFGIFDFALTEKEMQLFDAYDTGESIFCDRRDPERVKNFCKGAH